VTLQGTHRQALAIRPLRIGCCARRDTIAPLWRHRCLACSAPSPHRSAMQFPYLSNPSGINAGGAEFSMRGENYREPQLSGFPPADC